MTAPARHGSGWIDVVLATYGSDLPETVTDRFVHRGRGSEAAARQRALPGLASALNPEQERLIWPEVALTDSQREIVADAMRQRLTRLGAQVLAITVTEHHVRFLAKMRLNRTRQWIGHAKRHAWFALRSTGRKEMLWSPESKARQIDSRAEQVAVYRQLMAMRTGDAYLWSSLESKEEARPV